MLIRVIYLDGSVGVAANSSTLDSWIREKRIVAFCRQNENWRRVDTVLALTYEAGRLEDDLASE